MNAPSPALDKLFDLEHTAHAALFLDTTYPWDVLPRIIPYAEAWPDYAIRGRVHPGAVLEGPVAVGEGSEVGPGAMLIGPVIIGRNCQVRHGAFLRGGVLVGDGAVVGHACELKNCLLFDEAEVPHFAYVGDSVLGWKAHLGAGVKISNVKLDKRNIQIQLGGETIDTGLWKFGAMIGDRAEIGCNAVLNPGSIVGRDSIIYSGVSFRGMCEARSIVKLKQEQVVTPRR